MKRDRRDLLVAGLVGLAFVGQAVSETSHDFACDDGTHLNIRFVGDAAEVRRPDGPPRVLKIAPSGSGFRYAGEGWELRGKGDAITLEGPGTTRTCRVSDAPRAKGEAR